jgi:hypothetical protein
MASGLPGPGLDLEGVLASQGSAVDGKRAERAFFTGMATLLTVTVFAGFARTYYLRPLVGATSPAPPTLTPLIHVHGLLFSAWMALLVVQVRLVAAGRIGLHRRLGLAGAAVAALMVGVGTLTALHGVVRGVSPGGLDPRRFLAVPLFAVVVFAILVGAGIRARRDPQSHKRLLTLATVALLPPALARWVIVYLGFGPPAVLALGTLFVIPLVAWDLVTRGRLHPATLWGGLLVIASGPLRIAVAFTDGWLAFAEWAVALVR